MIPPLDEWDAEEESRDPRGCGLSIAVALVVWALLVAAVKAFWPS